MLLWIDGFEGYATSGTSLTAALIARRYPLATDPTNMSIQAGRVAGLSLKGASNTVSFTTPALTTDDTLIVGVAVKFASIHASILKIISLYDDATLGMNLKLDTGGELLVYRGTTYINTTTGLSLALNTWYYIEFKVKCNNSIGTYEIKVDNVSKLSGSGDTLEGAHSYHNKVQLSSVSLTNTTFDDYYICDGSGALNNTFLGPCRTLASNPNGDNSVNWSTVYPADGVHYTKEDDGATADDDTTYVEDATTGHRDLFDYAAVTVLTSIHGVAINTTCKVTDVNAVDLKTVAVSGANEVTATQIISATDYTTVSHISETDPNTSAAWDITALDAAQFGFEVG